MNRGQTLKVLAAAGATQLTGCERVRAFIAAARHHCPTPQLPPIPVAHVMRREESFSSQYADGSYGITTLTQGTPKRIVFALPGRAGSAGQLADFITLYFQSFHANAAVMCIDGGETYWHPRNSGEDRLSILLHEVVPHARRLFPKVRARYSIMGWSMGGFGAIVAAQQEPSLFDRVCAVSPALWQTYAEAVNDAFDSDADFARYNPFAFGSHLRGMDVRISCGTMDPFYDASVAFVDKLRKLHVRVSSEYYPNGCHDPASFARTAVNDIAFAVS